MTSTGIRELKNGLSHYVRRVEAGERISVTAHGRVIAELGPPVRARLEDRKGYEPLVARGLIVPATGPATLPAEWPRIRVPAGTAAGVIDADRAER